MAYRYLTEHPLHHTVKVIGAGYIRQQGFILFLHGSPIHTMHIRVVEIIAIYTPGFIENVFPFFFRRNLYLQQGSIQHSISSRLLPGK